MCCPTRCDSWSTTPTLTRVDSGEQVNPADAAHLADAVRTAATARLRSSPNPWVGAVVVAADGSVVGRGATEPPGSRHGEIVALEQAGEAARGATLFVTLEPCAHHGRTPPCTEAVVRSGVTRVVVGLVDPDPSVSGRGLAHLRSAGIDVTVASGAPAEEVARQLAPYLHHRRTGRPYVVCKLASSLDGRTAAPDGSSQWITGPEARADAHRLRAESDAVLVGAGTVRLDDPSLTVRDWHPAPGVAPRPPGREQPRRIVLGAAAPGARVHPCTQMAGPLDAVLDELGSEGVVQLLVEGGAAVAGAFHRAGLVQQYVIYLAPVLFGGADGHPLFAGPGAATIGQVWRGAVSDVTRLGADVRVIVDQMVR